MALAIAALLRPAVLTAIVLGFWRVGADAGMTGIFVIPRGFFSHWQVWFGVSLLTQSVVTLLDRYGTGQHLFRNSVEKEPDSLLKSEV